MIASDIYRHIRHALAGEPSDEFPYQEILNDAGEWLISAHRWGWITPEPADVDTVADQEYVSLPSDFREVVSIDVSDGFTSTIEPTTREHILFLRSSPLDASSFNFYYALGWRQLSGTMTSVLEVWPTPSASETGKFKLWYRKTWTRIASDSTALEIPPWMEPLLKRVCRAFAQGVEEEQTDRPAGSRIDVDDLLERVMAGPIWEAAVDQDRMVQQDYGPMRGGHLEGLPHHRATHFLSSQVAAPS